MHASVIVCSVYYFIVLVLVLFVYIYSCTLYNYIIYCMLHACMTEIARAH